MKGRMFARGTEWASTSDSRVMTGFSCGDRGGGGRGGGGADGGDVCQIAVAAGVSVAANKSVGTGKNVVAVDLMTAVVVVVGMRKGFP